MKFTRENFNLQRKIMFLPENYESPKAANAGYMKLQDGENRIRILSAPILGWEDWTLEKKPIRFRYSEKPTSSIDPKKPVKHFWAMIVWNYNEQKIQILEITQATIRKCLEKLCKDPDWGAPYFYDIKICKEGQNVDTEYTVNPISPKPVAEQIIDQFNSNPCNLEALFDNGDPFSREWARTTPGVFKPEDAKAIKVTISSEQAEDLHETLLRCDKEYVDKVWDALHKSNITSLNDLSHDTYSRILKAASKKAAETLNLDLPF